MFTVQITKFERTLQQLAEAISKLHEHVALVESKVDTLAEAVQHSLGHAERSWKQFEACAKGFGQVKNACECLREELSEAAGTICDRTWDDVDE